MEWKKRAVGGDLAEQDPAYLGPYCRQPVKSKVEDAGERLLVGGLEGEQAAAGRLVGEGRNAIPEVLLRCEILSSFFQSASWSMWKCDSSVRKLIDAVNRCVLGTMIFFVG